MALSVKVFLGIGAGLMLLSAMAVGTAATSFYQAGSIAVQVQGSDGTDVSIRVPAGLANLAIALVPGDLPSRFDGLEEIPEEARAYLPALDRLGDVLAEAPDFVMVEVHDGDEHVRVEKRRRSLIIDVTSDDGRVHVEVPVRTLRKALNKADDFLDAS